jgi:hypothetical protein
MSNWLGAALLIALAAVGAGISAAEPPPQPVLKTVSFDTDPGWEGHNNRVVPKVIKNVKQGFGYSATNFAGKEKGEIGGTIWRSATPAYYAAKLPAKTLHDKLTASGTFALTASAGSSGVFFGWFNSDAKRESSLGFHLAGQGAGARLTLRLVTGTNQACGTKVTPWEVDKTKPPGQRKTRPPEINNDGTRYTWTLEYDPKGGDGNGQMQFVIKGNSKTPHAFEGKTFTVNLPKGYKDQDTTFDCFGMWNKPKGGNPMTIYFDDVRYDGKAEDFSKDPGWDAVGNEASFEDREQNGVHDFGYSAKTSFAGGKAGEIGGKMWHSGDYGYYADKIGPLSLDDRLEANGRVVLNVASQDSVVFLGWFNSSDKEHAPTQAGNFVGVKIGGPTRIGHYFLPAYATARPKGAKIEVVGQHPVNVSVDRGTGPVFVPEKAYEWKLVYDPAGNGGKGTITATLGDESVTLALKNGDKEKGASFDRFGLFTGNRGGSFVRIYFDDLKYTAARPGR